MKLIQKGLLFLLFAATALNATVPQAPQEETVFVSAAVMQPIIEKTLATIAKLDAVIEDISLEISVGTLRPIEKKEIIIKKLTGIRQITLELKNQEFLGAQPQDLMRISSLTDALLKLLNTALKNNFKDFGAIELESIITRAVKIEDEATPEELDKKITGVSKACDRLSITAKTAGLSWYNHAFRKIDRTIIQPCFKYEIPKYTAIAGLTALAAFTGWFYSDYPSPEGLRSYVGHAWKEGMIGQDPNDPARPINSIGNFFKALTDYSKGGLAPLNYIVPTLTVAYGLAASKINAYVGEKVSDAANFLRGGEYRFKKSGITEWNDVSSTFDSIIGCEYQKQQCLPILDYLANAEMHGRKKSFPDKGYLLIGGPGSGKTEFAKALCGEIKKQLSDSSTNFKFLEIPVSAIILPESSGGIGGIGNLFRLLREVAPVVVFIDEIHLLQAQTSNPQLLSEFLTGMSGFVENDPAKQIIVLAATNKPELLDDALRRKGRFGTTLNFDLPNFENRREYLIRRLSQLSLDHNHFDVDQLARETDGCNYEDLNSMVKSAFRKAKIMGTTVSQQLLEDSLNDEIRSIIHSPDENISAQEQALIAGYLTGSAFARFALNTVDKVSYITLNPVNVRIAEKSLWQDEINKKPISKQAIQYGKVFTYRPTDSLKIDTKSALELEIKVLLAGTIAQELLFKTCTLDYQTEDTKRALEIAQKICFNGMDQAKLPKEVQKEKLTEAYNLVVKLEAEIKQKLEENRKALEMLTEALVAYKSFSGAQFVYHLDFLDRLSKDQLTPEEKTMIKQLEEHQKQQKASTEKENPESIEKQIGLEAVTQ